MKPDKCIHCHGGELRIFQYKVSITAPEHRPVRVSFWLCSPCGKNLSDALTEGAA